jgi:uncharacterized protein involved in exopolysaccharide biosynthesis
MTNLSTNALQPSTSTSLRDLLHVFFKHKAEILAIFILTVATVIVISFSTTPAYEANARLLVKIGREYMSQPEVGEGQSLMMLDQEGIINSEIQILNNRELIEKVVTAMGVDILYPSLVDNAWPRTTQIEVAVGQFINSLEVWGVDKSSVIGVSFQHHDQVVAEKALTILIDFFKAKHLEVFSNPQSSFLEQQLVNYKQRLKTSESAYESFKQQYKVYSVEEQRSLLLQQQVTLDTDSKSINNRIAELQKKIAAHRGQLQDITQSTNRYTQTARDGIVVDAETRLLELQLKEQELLAKNYREDGRLVGNVRNEIQLVRNFLEAQEENIRRKTLTTNPVYQGLEQEMLKSEAELASQQAKAVTLAQQLSQLERKIQSVDQKQNELRSLQRELSINEKNYQTYVEKLEEARISDNLDRQNIANISVIKAPVASVKLVKPSTSLKIILGVLLGTIGGLGFAFFSEFTSQSFSIPEQVEKRLGLPVLTSITLKEG